MPNYNQTYSYPFGIALTLKFPEDHEITQVSSLDPTNDIHLFLVYDKDNISNMHFKDYFVEKGTFTKLAIKKTRINSISKEPDYICADKGTKMKALNNNSY